MTNKEAIQWLKGIVKLFFGRGYYDTQRREALDLAIKELEERPKGKWIKESNGKTTDLYICSVCKRSIMLCKGADLTNYPFCHCGADMRGGQE